VDMRPRRSGSVGPLACSLSAFSGYPHDRAGAPELAALLRGRVVWSEGGLGERFEGALRAALVMPREEEALADGFSAMRGREWPAGGDIWAVGRMADGWRDAAAAADFLQLRHAADHPAVLAGDPARVFEAAGALKLIGEDAAADLAEAVRLWRNLLGTARLIADDAGAEAAGPALPGAIGRSGGKLVVEALADTAQEAGARAARHVDAILGARRLRKD